MSSTIASLEAREILDSRSRPTLEVTLVLDDGTRAAAGVPSGASTGAQEPVELRDGDPERYAGAGVLQAARNVGDVIAPELRGRPVGRLSDLASIDQALWELDGTANLSRLGANAVVGVSMAAARAAAAHAGTPLWRFLSEEYQDGRARMPVPHFNVVNGGAHASNDLDFQEFMVAPVGAPSYTEALRAGSEIYGSLRGLLRGAGQSTGLGDEGGFAPAVSKPEQVLALLVEAIEVAGYHTGPHGVMIAIDPAANGFHDSKQGIYRVAGADLDAAALVDRYAQMVERFPIWSIEDGHAETDLSGWSLMTQRLGGRVQVVGDDLLVTNPARISMGVRDHWATAALIKVNQVGTVTQTLEALRRCRDAGWGAMISHRSGETTDDFIADLAVASGCGQIKSGAPARGERLAKYNRLLAIDASASLPFGIPTDW
ncbi:phosphopyruvate hydratase [Segeticoccus rhizosphaerae]|uniref:phosphopyruvate hydratase n=1 Tax=Segeticoccus rhizosphaerae TaxID=1104777 RepID=UPI0010C0FDBD|nr:phosphopyruvate hydratase [Ornithinicoccus soli]